MRLGSAAAIAAVIVLTLAGCAGSGTDIPGFQGGGPTGERSPEASPTPTASEDSPSATPEPTPSESSASPTPTPTETVDPGAIDCGAQPVTLNRADITYTLSGDCPSVLVEATGAKVTGGAIGALEIRGQGNTVTVTSVGPVTISGGSNAVSAQVIDTYAITGDLNILTSASTVNTGVITGGSNQVHGPAGVGAVTDNGAGNYVGV